MSNELIRVKNASYARYEELLMLRDSVNKEAFNYEREYTRVFGDLILELFRKKVECICKKKTIEYCRVFINQGKNVDPVALQAYLLKEMLEYQKQLEEMVENNEAAKKAESVSQSDMMKIKRIYHRMVKKLHPDINPLTEENEDLWMLWQRLITAYNCNDLKEMEETEVLINKALEDLKLGNMEIEIPDIEEKILELEAEIEMIKLKDPYQFKYLLEDPVAVEEKKDSIRKEIRDFEEYGRQLQEMLDELM